MIRVLVAEDSAVTREYLVYALEGAGGLEVVGTARNGLEAVEQVERLRPDVVVMDVNMPRANGYEATRQIMERSPTPIVMVSASFSRDDVAMSFEALAAGALTLVEKPAGPGHPDHAETTRRLAETVRLMAAVKVVRRFPRRQPLPAPAPVAGAARKIRLVAIGASTGGPAVLPSILGGLPPSLAVPILAVQHISPGFIQGLAEWLGRATGLDTRVAQAGEVARPGVLYFAPDAAQMGITREGRILLAREGGADTFRPSVSYLFRSAAAAYGSAAMGVLLTGMGTDGADGLLELRRAGALTIAQDEASSVVFGMPGAAIGLGAARHILSPEEIRAALAALATPP